MTLPPFLAGQHAFSTGKPITANPHPFHEHVAAEDYPGAHRNWHDGWHHARSVKDFTEASKQED